MANRSKMAPISCPGVEVEIIYIFDVYQYILYFPPCLPTVAFMFNLPDAATVKKVVHSLPRVGVGTNFGLPQTR